jgi:catechol 2,3-dioxygenase-like lactoylglutathione lyase family enzyme
MSEFPPVTHVLITVSDLARSVPWYQGLTGSEPVLDEDTGPFRHVVFAVGDLLLSPHGFHEGTPADDRFDERRMGLDHVALGSRTATSSRGGRPGWMGSGSRMA